MTLEKKEESVHTFFLTIFMRKMLLLKNCLPDLQTGLNQLEYLPS